MKPLFTTLLILVAFSGYSQIRYTDLVPDYKQNATSQKSFDLNDDGVMDIIIDLAILNPTSDVWFTVETIGSTQICYDPDDNGFVRMFKKQERIDQSLDWDDGYLSIAYLTTGIAEGSWPGSGKNYIGFRLKNEEQKYQYGWISMDVHKKVTSYKVEDFAIEISGDYMLSGQNITSIELSEREAGLEVYHYSNALDIENSSSFEQAAILDSKGNIVAELALHKGVQRFETAYLPAGLYVVWLFDKTRGNFYKFVKP